ncbi:MAG: hypothetical protein WDZ42_01640 [Candidatus Saccharimonadales bacterium]
MRSFVVVDPPALLGSFAADNYWSSSQYNSSNAWRQNFNNGNQNNNAKSNSYRVRACRVLTIKLSFN